MFLGSLVDLSVCPSDYHLRETFTRGVFRADEQLVYEWRYVTK